MNSSYAIVDDYDSEIREIEKEIASFFAKKSPRLAEPTSGETIIKLSVLISLFIYSRRSLPAWVFSIWI